MIIEDKIWGKFEIKEKILEELLQSKEVQRLKGIAQFGLPYKYYSLPGFSRYEHSVGVMLLLRKIGASLDEQVAGLLHDVSHTAFSHLIDWVVGDRINEGYQDKKHKESFNGNLGEILKKHGFSKDNISEYSNFSLLEQPSPDLCADRVDYAIREFNYWAAPKTVSLCKDSLRNYYGKIVFASKEPASAFGVSYIKLQKDHWGGAECTLRWEIFSQILKRGIENKIISIKDFEFDDESVIEKLKNSGDLIINKKLGQLRRKLKYDVVEGLPATYHLHKKFRSVDPYYFEGDRVVRLGEMDRDYACLIEKERVKNKEGLYIKMQ